MTTIARPKTTVDPSHLQRPTYLRSRAFYTDPALFALEMKHIVPSSWMFVCDVSEVGTPGDYVTAQIGAEPVVIVRGSDDQLRAFSNVCPHRGSTIAEGRGNCGGALQCPYHGWKYRLTGELSGVPFRGHFEPSEVPVGVRLDSARVQVWQRLVFVTFSPDVPELLDCLEDLPSILDSSFAADLRLVYRGRDTYGLNWKLWADNSFDSYHLPFLHKDTIGKDLNLRDEVHMEAGPFWTAHGSARLSAHHTQRDGRAIFAYLYPGLQISVEPDGTVFVVAALPAIDSTVTIEVAAYMPAALTDSIDNVDISSAIAGELFQSVRREDIEQCARIEATMQSGRPTTGPTSTLSIAEAAFHDWLRAQYRSHTAHGATLGVPSGLLDGSTQ